MNLKIYADWSLKKMNKERKKWIITFSNGYCGCDQEEEFVGTYVEATDYATEMLRDYAESMSHVAFDWDEDYDDDEFEEYCENCGFDIEESEEEE